MAGMRHTVMWITIIDYQLVTSEQQLKQALDNYSKNGIFNNFSKNGTFNNFSKNGTFNNFSKNGTFNNFNNN